MTYLVRNGLNLGPDDKRFEVGDTISDEELSDLVPTKKTRAWLIDGGHIEKQPTKKAAKKATASATSSDDDSGDE